MILEEDEKEKGRKASGVLVERISQNDDASVVSEPELDKHIIAMYKRVGLILSTYRDGKIPKAFEYIPSIKGSWKEILYTTEPENWSPHAMYHGTRVFASSSGVKKAENFNKLVLLPRVRKDIRENQRLHFELYQALETALHKKPAGFFKGILFPLCESQTCTLKEAVIVARIIEKVSIPRLHSSVALMMLAGMEYCDTTSYFIKLLLEKECVLLPRRVVGAVVDHFMKFLDETRIMPDIWHQSLLAFVQRNELQKEDKDQLRVLLEMQKHELLTPEISRELNLSRNQGEKEDDLMSISLSPMSLDKPIEEGRFDIPGVPMDL